MILQKQVNTSLYQIYYQLGTDDLMSLYFDKMHKLGDDLTYEVGILWCCRIYFSFTNYSWLYRWLNNNEIKKNNNANDLVKQNDRNKSTYIYLIFRNTAKFQIKKKYFLHFYILLWSQYISIKFIYIIKCHFKMNKA